MVTNEVVWHLQSVTGLLDALEVHCANYRLTLD